MANMTFKTNILPNSDFGYSLGSSTNPQARWNIHGNLTGNADTATKDADGFVFPSTYVKLVAGTNIPATSAAHADLNALDLQKTGSYSVSTTANVPYVDHMPSDYSTTLTDHPAFMMNVYAPLSSTGTTTSGNWIYRIQEIIPYNNHIYRWRRMNSTNGSGTWSFGTWTRQVLTDTNTNMDTLVKQTALTTDASYKLLATASASPTSGNAAEAIYDANITINPKTHTITATNFAGNATTATTATKLGTANKGSSIQPIYLSAGVPTACTIPSNGAWWSAIPQILPDGVMEVGKYIDFHTASNGTTDYDVRITADTTGLTMTGNLTIDRENDTARFVVKASDDNKICGIGFYVKPTEDYAALIGQHDADPGGSIVLRINSAKKIDYFNNIIVGESNNKFYFEDGSNSSHGMQITTFKNGSARGFGISSNGYVDTSGTFVSSNKWWFYRDPSKSGNLHSGLEIYASKFHGTVSANDYAEMRNVPEAQGEDNPLKPGTCVREVGDGTMIPTTERLQRGCKIISDTFGFNIGETEDCKTPIAVSGRALVYLDQNRKIARDYIGWPVCSGPNGTVSIMTEEEEEKYPSRIVGTISEIPDYEKWGSSNVEVKGRIWIYVK